MRVSLARRHQGPGSMPGGLPGGKTAMLFKPGDNRWSSAARDSLCWPYGVAACADTLASADSGNNRVLLWDVAP